MPDACPTCGCEDPSHEAIKKEIASTHAALVEFNKALDLLEEKKKNA